MILVKLLSREIVAKRTYIFDKKVANYETEARGVINDASSAAGRADKALIDARKGTQEAKDLVDAFRIKWFGDFTASAKGRLDDLQAKIHKIVYVLDVSPFTVTYGGANGNENALATHYAVAPPGLASYGRGMAAFNDLTLRTRFFTMPRSGMKAQSQIETVIHELSHIAFTSADELLPAAHPSAAGNKAYGPEHALWLAKNSADQAFNNAENFGFFVMEFLKAR